MGITGESIQHVRQNVETKLWKSKVKDCPRAPGRVKKIERKEMEKEVVDQNENARRGNEVGWSFPGLLV